MDTVQFADGSSLIMGGSRGGDRLDKGFNKLDKINKKSRYFFVIYNSGI